MLKIPPHVEAVYKSILEKNGVALKSRSFYLKWLRYYLDFCEKYQFDRQSSDSLMPFIKKLSQKKQTAQQQQQARQAVRFFHLLSRLPGKRNAAPGEVKTTSTKALQEVKGAQDMVCDAMPAVPGATPSTPGYPSVGNDIEPQKQRRHNDHNIASAYDLTGETSPLEGIAPLVAKYALSSAGSGISISEKSELKPIGADWRKIYHELETAIKVRHYSPRTLKVYRSWTRQFQTFTKSKDHRLISVDDVKAFLSFLAVKRKVSASSQNQAFNALLFLFRHVLGKEFGTVEGVVRAKRKPYIPVCCHGKKLTRLSDF